MKTYFARLQNYSHWANQLVLENLKSQPAPESAFGLLSHIFLAEKAWLTRLEGAHPAFPVFQVLQVEELELLVQEIDRGWKAFLASEEDFEREVGAKNKQLEQKKVKKMDVQKELK